MPGWGVHQRRGRSIIMRRWRASMPELAACTCTRLTGSLGLYRFNRTAHPWLGGGGGSRPRRAVDSDYDGDTRICHSISIDVIPYRPTNEIVVEGESDWLSTTSRKAQKSSGGAALQGSCDSRRECSVQMPHCTDAALLDMQQPSVFRPMVIDIRTSIIDVYTAARLEHY